LDVPALTPTQQDNVRQERAKYDGLDANFDTTNDWQEKKARLVAEKLKRTFGKS
jgi:hypothetical protein